MFESKKHDREYGMQESRSADQANVPVTAVTVTSQHSHCLQAAADWKIEYNAFCQEYPIHLRSFAAWLCW